MSAERSFVRSALSDYGRSLGARGGVLPIVALSGLATIRLQIDELGVSAFAVVALLAALPALIPIGDLGMGAAVTNAVAEHRDERDAAYLGTLVSSVRILFLVGSAIAVVSIVFGLSGVWGGLLGLRDSDVDVDLAAACALTVFGLSLPLALGHRFLLGLRKNHVAILVQAGATVGSLLLTVIGVVLDLPVAWFASAAALSAGVGGLVAWLIACRIAHVSPAVVLRDCADRSVRGDRLAHVAAPMAVVTVALPIAYQSDRLVLTWTTTLTSVAVYSVAAQLYAPMLSLVSSAGQTFWASFARARTEGGSVGVDAFARICATSTLVGVVGAAGLLVLGRPLARLVSGGEVVPSFGLLGAFGLLLVLFAAYWPAGMVLTDARGLRLQAVTSVAMVVVNLPLSIVFAERVGAAGPVVASFVAVALCMLVPGMREAVRRVR